MFCGVVCFFFVCFWRLVLLLNSVVVGAVISGITFAYYVLFNLFCFVFDCVFGALFC